MKFAGAIGLNCFFGLMLFSAIPKSFGRPDQQPAKSLHPVSQKNLENQLNMETKKIGLAIHGGAGTIERNKMTPDREREYRAGLENALTAGWEILKRGGLSIDATEAAVR